MFRETLALQQPVVYQILDNALKKESLSHCYLFAGPRGTLKQETAFLLAQSVICSHKTDGWACEECLECIRVRENNYVDLIYLDGSKGLLKIEHINTIQNQFSQTAVEAAGKKVFIINDCENMTLKAANSLLKFIEEPSDNVTGIFITSQIDRLLPTIVSRCQKVSFKPLPKTMYYDFAIENGIDELNAHLLSQMVQDRDQLLEISQQESYQNAVRTFVEFMNYFFRNKKTAITYLENNAFSSGQSDRKNDRDSFQYFLNIANIFTDDYHNNKSVDDDSWTDLLEKAHDSDFDSVRFLTAVSQARDALIRSANLSLVIDQLLYRISGGDS